MLVSIQYSFPFFPIQSSNFFFFFVTKISLHLRLPAKRDAIHSGIGFSIGLILCLGLVRLPLLLDRAPLHQEAREESDGSDRYSHDIRPNNCSIVCFNYTWQISRRNHLSNMGCSSADYETRVNRWRQLRQFLDQGIAVSLLYLSLAASDPSAAVEGHFCI